ncbi:helix-turn-helix domain-containing protein [Paenibacillus glucanolyticus]
MCGIKRSVSEKYAIIQKIRLGKIGVKAAVEKYGISKSTLAKWRRRYEIYGYEGLEVRTHNRSYSAELKLQAVLDYLNSGRSKYQIIDKYKIASRNKLTRWINKYK